MFYFVLLHRQHSLYTFNSKSELLLFCFCCVIQSSHYNLGVPSIPISSLNLLCPFTPCPLSSAICSVYILNFHWVIKGTMVRLHPCSPHPQVLIRYLCLSHTHPISRPINPVLSTAKVVALYQILARPVYHPQISKS